MPLIFEDLKIDMIVKCDVYNFNFEVMAIDTYRCVLRNTSGGGPIDIGCATFDQMKFEEVKSQYPSPKDLNWNNISIQIKKLFDTSLKSGKPVISDVQKQSDYEFFAKTSPGHCACGMPRQSCDYHKD